MLSLLPQDGRAIPGFREFLAKFGSLDQLYVVFTAPDGQSIDDYRDDIDAWVDATPSGAGDRARRMPAPSIGLAISAGSPSVSFSCSATVRSTRRSRASRPKASPRQSPRRRELLSVPSDEIAAARSTGPGGSFGTGARFRRRRAERARPANRRPDTSPQMAAAGSSSRIRCGRHSTPSSRERSTRASAIDIAHSEPLDVDDESLPPLQVEFAGGHRIAVETEALVRRESIVNTVGSLALILPLLFIVFRSLWLVAVGSLPSALSLARGAGRARVRRRHACRPPPPAPRRCSSVWAIDGVVLLYVAHRLALAEGQSPTAAVASGAGPDQHAARHVDDRGHVLRPDVRRLSQPAAARAADRPQHAGLRRADAGAGAGAAAAACSPRRAITRADDAAPGGMDRAASRHRSWRARPLATVLLGVAALGLRVDPTLDRLRSVTDAARLEEQHRRRLRAAARRLRRAGRGPRPGARCSRRTSSSRQRCLERSAGARVAAADAAAAVGRRADATARERIQRSRLSPDGGRGVARAGRRSRGFRPGAFEPFAARLPALLDPTEPPHLRRLRRARSRRSDRPVRRPRRRPLDRWPPTSFRPTPTRSRASRPSSTQRRSGADADRPAAGQPRARRTFLPAVHQRAWRSAR